MASFAFQTSLQRGENRRSQRRKSWLELYQEADTPDTETHGLPWTNKMLLKLQSHMDEALAQTSLSPITCSFIY